MDANVGEAASKPFLFNLFFHFMENKTQSLMRDLRCVSSSFPKLDVFWKGKL
jgi:hypothetical protein